MKGKEKIDKWLEDEAFMSFAQKRTTEIARYILNNYPYDLKYEELDECFGRDDRYVVPVVDYLVYRLHRAKLKKTPRNAEKESGGYLYKLSSLGMTSNISLKNLNGCCQNCA